jgi:multidrug efflux pump subunit AcrA (membrane-fusion protein)
MNDIWRAAISLAIVGAGIGGFLLMGTPQVPTQAPRKPGKQLVKMAIAEEHTDGIQFEVDGIVVPFRRIDLAAQVSGRIAYKSDACRVGRAVEAGELLIRIDKDDYEIEVKRLQEEVNQAQAMLDELEAELVTVDNQIATARQQLNIDARELERSANLVDRRITSDSELDDARRAELTSRNALQILQDQKNLLSRRRVRLESVIALERADLEKAELDLQRTEIRSPLDGVVVAENVEQDGFIQTGNTLVSLQDASQLDVICKLHMHQMYWLWQGKYGDTGDTDQPPGRDLMDAYAFPETPATIVYSLGGSTYEWQGIVNRFDGAGIDSQTRMIPCRVHVDDPLSMRLVEGGETVYAPSNPPTLMTGMFVKVRIHAQPPIPLVRLPQAAIQPDDFVWTVHEGKLKRKAVVVATAGEKTVVAYQQIDGLQAGDQVVVSPLPTPVEGLAVVDEDELPLPSKSPAELKGRGAADMRPGQRDVNRSENAASGVGLERGSAS